jgi:hypothetical protein
LCDRGAIEVFVEGRDREAEKGLESSGLSSIGLSEESGRVGIADRFVGAFRDSDLREVVFGSEVIEGVVSFV